MDRGSKLADAVDPAFALLEPRGIPRQIEVDESFEPLEVQAFRRGIGSDQDPQRALLDAGLDVLPGGAAAAAGFQQPNRRMLGPGAADVPLRLKQAAGQRRIQAQGDIVEHQLSFYPHLQLAPGREGNP